MTAPNLSTAQWRKSSRSSANGQCVEVAEVGATIAVRDSKDPAGPALTFDQAGWTAFLTATKAGGLHQR